MADIDFWLPTRIVFGEGSLERISTNLADWHARSALVVTDSTVAKMDVIVRLSKLLRDQGTEPCLFTSVEPNPTVENVGDGLALAVNAKPDLFIAVGGGSVIDAAKAINLVFTNGGAIEDYAGLDRASQPGKPLVAVPTTAGTGSEVSKIAIITNQAGNKMVINDFRIAPWLAVVDPELTYTCPPRLTAIAGMDAITHAIESFTSRNARVMTEPLSFAALQLLAAHIQTAVTDGRNASARHAMAAGSNMTAIGMSYAGLGICHSLANPLTKHFQVPHGLACALVLPWVLEFNWTANPAKFSQVSNVLVGGVRPEDIADRGQALLKTLGLGARLSDYGMTREVIPSLAAEAMLNPANRSNARAVTEADLGAVLRQAL